MENADVIFNIGEIYNQKDEDSMAVKYYQMCLNIYDKQNM